MVIIKPEHVIQCAIDGITDPLVAFAQRRFGWNRFELMARIEFVRTPVDFVLGTWLLLHLSRADGHDPPLPSWMLLSFFAVTVFWSFQRLRSGWEMYQAGMGSFDEMTRTSSLVARARKVGVRHWYWTLFAMAGCVMLPLLGLAGLIDGFPLFCAEMFGLSAYIAVTLLSHALWNHPDVSAILPPLFTDD